jgi:ATP-binding cassette, subfamily B, bacterial
MSATEAVLHDQRGLVCCSALAGRERWEVPAIHWKPQRARALAVHLAQQPGIHAVHASEVSGRVLIQFDPDALAQPVRALLEAWIVERRPGAAPGLSSGSSSLSPSVSSSLSPSASSSPSPSGSSSGSSSETGALSLRDRALAGVRSSPLALTLRRAGLSPQRMLVPVLLTIGSQVLHLLQGFSFVATVNAARSPARAAGASSFLVRSALTTSLMLGATLCRLLRRNAWQRLAREVEQDLRAQLFEHVQDQDLAFFDEHGTGQLLTLLDGDVAQVGAFVDRAFDQATEKAVTVGLSTAVLLRTSPLLAITAFLSVPAMWLITRTVAGRTIAAHARSREQAEQFTQLLDNALSRVVDIKSFGAEDRESARFRDHARALGQASLEVGELRSLEQNLAQGVFSSGFTVIAAYGASLVTSDELELERYTRALHTFPELARVFGAIPEITNLYRGAAASAARLQRIFDARPTIRSGSLALARCAVRGQVELVDVTFGYRPDAPVIRRMTLTVPPGETLGIVGPTGSGKSTLLRLLTRLYDPSDGSVRLDGVDLRELCTRDLRLAVGLVSQDAYVFRGTIRDNVCYGRADATSDEIVAALEIAQAWEFVCQLPDGLDADVGEGGRRLSAGQRQRLAIARVVLADAPILALDEATSNLDYGTESQVYRALFEAARGKTKLVIAHRLSTVKDADRIAVLDRGELRETGTHDQLLERDGLYASLWRLQSGDVERAGRHARAGRGSAA